MSKDVLSIFQIILGIALVALVLLQVKGTGLGSTFGGELSFYHTKRGVEKILFYLTMIVSGLFLLSSASLLIV